ncbi:LuxR C-terminal-related transcriptional regulator [Cystobacter fuscus]|uniref:LuxR C-terminal-related transcriptional regulator n=1 Tax=Cystobacter fuscus TaxID=43 RepID=UPI002B2EA780|nr:DNA-binding response regulator [Cystobacter fuscus]
MKRDQIHMKPKERLLIGQLVEALNHAKTLSEVVRTTEDSLIRLTSADCMALCASRIGQPSLDDWLVAKMPEVYFARYEEWKKDDFIRDANVRNPNRVMRDGDIIAHKDLQATKIYRIGQDMGVPLEHVMSVYLTQAGWDGNGGFSAYRLKPRPFSDHERDLIQYIAPHLASAIQRCQVFVERELTGRLLEAQTVAQKTASLVLTTRFEVVRSLGPIARLMEKWFTDPPGQLPLALLEKLNKAMSQASFLQTGTGVWEMEGSRKTLRVTYFQLPPVGNKSYWQLRFQEVTHPQLIVWLKVLTPKEIEIANLLYKGLSDKEIADRLLNKKGEKNSPGTVKKHLGHIYEKLKPFGVANRADFMARAHLPCEDEE